MNYENFEMFKNDFTQDIYFDWANWCNASGLYYIKDLGNKYVTQEFAQTQPSYAEKRASEYPKYAEYLDAQVKINSENPELISQGQMQLDKYFADCLDVKNKYPKL